MREGSGKVHLKSQRLLEHRLTLEARDRRRDHIAWCRTTAIVPFIRLRMLRLITREFSKVRFQCRMLCSSAPPRALLAGGYMTSSRSTPSPHPDRRSFTPVVACSNGSWMVFKGPDSEERNSGSMARRHWSRDLGRKYLHPAGAVADLALSSPAARTWTFWSYRPGWSEAQDRPADRNCTYLPLDPWTPRCRRYRYTLSPSPSTSSTPTEAENRDAMCGNMIHFNGDMQVLRAFASNTLGPLLFAMTPPDEREANSSGSQSPEVSGPGGSTSCTYRTSWGSDNSSIWPDHLGQKSPDDLRRG